MNLMGLGVILFFYLFSFTLAGFMAYARLNKENILSDEEKKKWKKYLTIMSAVTIAFFILIFVWEHISFWMFMPRPLPYYYDFPTGVRLAVGNF